MSEQASQYDVTVRDEGSIVMFVPESDAARQWVDEHVQEPIWFGDALAVEPRYAAGLIVGMAEDGLGVDVL